MTLPRKLSRAVVIFATTVVLAYPAFSQTVIATIPVNSPSQIDVDPRNELVYVAAQTAVIIIDENTNTVKNHVSVGVNITGVAVNPFTHRYYAADENAGAVYVLDTTTNEVLDTIPVGTASVVNVNIRTNRIYVNDFSSTVTVIDGDNDQIIASIAVTAAHGMSVDPFTNRIYVAQDLFPGKVAVIDGSNNTVTDEVNTGGDLTFDVAVDPVHRRAYAANQFGNVGVIDTASDTLITTVQTGGQPAGVAADPFTRRIFVTDVSGNTVIVIDGKTNQVINTVPVGTQPTWAAADPIRKLLYVSDNGSNDVAVLKLD